MKRHLSNLVKAVRNFHEDEQGMEAMQAVMLTAIGAVVIGTTYKYLWPKVYTRGQANVDQMSSYQPDDPSKLANR